MVLLYLKFKFPSHKDAFSPSIPQHARCILSWDRGVYCRGGDWGDCCRFLHNFSSYGSISQKSIRFRKKAFIKEYMATYKSLVHIQVFANTSTQFRWSGRVWHDHMFIIDLSGQFFVYFHIYFTDNSKINISTLQYSTSKILSFHQLRKNQHIS